MKWMVTKLVITMVTPALLSACSTLNRPSETAATVKSQPTQAALAFQANAAFGGGLSSADRAALSRAERRALDFGKAGDQVGWKSDSGKASGTIVASQPFRVGESNCRRFEHNLTGASGPSKANGTACKRADGNWQLVR